MIILDGENSLTSTRSIWIKSAACGLILTAGGFAFFAPLAGASVLIGVLLSLTNFWLLERLIAGMVAPRRPKRWRLVAKFIGKALLLFGLLGLVVKKLPIDAAALLVGLSTIVIGIALEGLSGLVRPQTHA